MNYKPHHFSLHEISIAKKSIDILKKTKITDNAAVYLNVNNKKLELPVSIVSPLIKILSEISKDCDLEALQLHDEEWLSSQEAADLLHVSRPFMVKLIDAKKIPCVKVGRHRRILKADLLSYKDKSLEERKKILQHLVDEAQDLDMGY